MHHFSVSHLGACRPRITFPSPKYHYVASVSFNSFFIHVPTLILTLLPPLVSIAFFILVPTLILTLYGSVQVLVLLKPSVLLSLFIRLLVMKHLYARPTCSSRSTTITSKRLNGKHY